EEHEDLDEDRRVADHLDVDGRELAGDRDPVCARGAEHDPDCVGAGDRDRRHLEGVDEAGEELVVVLGDERPDVVARREHRLCAAGGGRAAASRVVSYWQTVSALGAPGAGYWNVWFGRRMLFENEVRKRGGTFAFRIGMN